MRFSNLITALAIAQAAIASVHIRAGKEERGSRCDTVKRCKYFYTTGSAQCQTGFTRTHHEAKGDPPGSYCERDCNSNERAACIKKNCNYYEQQCHLYPKSGSICGAAVEWCDGPVAMLKTICTSKIMGRTVTYNDDKHLCIPKGKTAGSRKAIPLRLGGGASFNAEIYDPSVKDGYLQMHCFDLTFDGAKYLAEKAAKATTGCTTTLKEDEGNTGYELLNVKCKTPKKKWSDVEKVLSQTCWESKPFKKSGPHFNSLKFSGQPK